MHHHFQIQLFHDHSFMCNCYHHYRVNSFCGIMVARTLGIMTDLPFIAQANYDLPIWGDGGGNSAESSRRQGQVGNETGTTLCVLEDGTPFAKRFLICFGLLGLIYCIREGCRRLYMHFFPDEPPPPDMAFPVWEGPVALTQVFGLCDVSLAMVTSACWIWSTVSALCLAFGIGIVAFGAYRIHTCIKAGEMKWKKSKIKHPTTIREEFKQIVSTKQKLSACFLIFFAMRFSGDWAKHSALARFWGFLVANFSSTMWIYFSMKLFGKLLNAFVTNVIPGSFSAAFFYTKCLFYHLRCCLVMVLFTPYKTSLDHGFFPYS